MKKSIYYLLGNSSYIEPKSGDQISEINIINSINQFNVVYYNNNLFGTKSLKINEPAPGHPYYFVRNNKDIFLKIKDYSKNIKIYFGSPYNQKAFDFANYISVYTDSWRDKLINGWDFPYNAYPDNFKINNVISIKQCIDDRFHPINKYHDKTKLIREKIGGDFIIGHFGRVTQSCYPYLFDYNVKYLKKKYPGLRILFAGNNSIKNTYNSNYVTYENYAYADMPYAVAACDLILYNYNDLQGHIAGSMKVMEAIATGVPILLPRYDAREEELGLNYPLFYEFQNIKDIRTGVKYRNYSAHIKEDFLHKIERAINKEDDLENYLYERSLPYRLVNHSTEIKKLLESL